MSLPSNAPGTVKPEKPAWRKVAVLAAIVALALAAVYLSPLRDYVGKVREVSAYVRGLGYLGPLVFTCGVAVSVACGVPRLPFCVIAGMAFGFWWGLLWAQTGTLTGNYAIFLLARYGAGEWAERMISRRGRVLIQREGIAGVLVARQLPVPGMLVNVTCGLVGIRQVHFLLGTAVGQLPEAIPCTLIGAGALQANFARSAGAISLAVALAVVAWVGLRMILRTAGGKLPERAAP